MSATEAWDAAQRSIAAAAVRSYPQEYASDLDARIRIVHGAEVLADNAESDDAMCVRFENWVAQHFPPVAG